MDESNSFMKNNFEVAAQCGSQFACANQNMLARIQNSLAQGLNKSLYLPKYILFVLDIDLIEHLGT